ELSNRTLQYLVDAAHWQRYCDSALQRSLKRDANFIWCSKCGGGGWVDPTQPTSKCGWNCPLCDNSFVYCPLCRRDHGSVSCKRFHKLRKEVVLGKQQAQDRDSAGVVQRSSKSCPSCKMPIQKDGGCNYMDCPNCRRHFCWSCGQIMKSSHQKHKCDAGFEASGVVGKTTQGRPCVELTRLFMNVIDIDSVEVMNVDDDDVQDCKDMLVPSADQEAKSPLFVGPSQMDGEILLRLPFNFTSAISWEVTHIHVRATHPPAPNCCRPKSLGLLANSPSATFSDFDDSTAVTVNLEDMGNGVFRASLEPFRTKGTFKRITCLAVKVCAAAAGEHEDQLQ
ncbi:RNF14, partial [Symbiodinium necroappetens]